MEDDEYNNIVWTLQSTKCNAVPENVTNGKSGRKLWDSKRNWLRKMLKICLGR